MRIASLLLALLVSAPAYAEFTAQEKSVVDSMLAAGNNARVVLMYAGNEYYSNTTAAGQAAALQVALQAYLVQEEIQKATNNLVGSLSTDIPENRPLSVTLQPAHRVERATFYWNRATGGYLNGALRTAVNSMLAVGAVTSNMQNYALVYVGYVDAAGASVNISCCGFVNREPDWWPFLVRRAADDVGVHGHFEVATEELSQGMNYLMLVQSSSIKAMQKWTTMPPQATRLGLALQLSTYRTLFERLVDTQHSAFGIGGAAPDQFTRLFDADEDALVGGGAGLRVLVLSGFKVLVRDALANGQTATSTDLADALLKLGDGWGQAVDLWTWDSIRFPCISGFDSVGCQIGKPVEALLPQ